MSTCLSIKKGTDLQAGTYVYYYPGSSVVVCKEICAVSRGVGFLKLFYILGLDGLWATELARLYWKFNPDRHPHASLFEILSYRLNLLEVFQHC